jgi:ubiquinone/menaquinone biosynthesis C-methylase UbiE
MKQDDLSRRVQEAYKQIARSYIKKVRSGSLDHRFIEKFLTLFEPGQKVLDVGAGTGEMSAEMLTHHQLEVQAIDFSPEMVQLAKKEHPGLRIRRMDLRKLAFPPKSFDGVFAMYSLIHIPEGDVPDALVGINRVMRPGGFIYLALQEPRHKMQKDGFYPVVYNRKINMFINLITEGEMRTYLKNAGFTVKDVYRRPPHVETEYPFTKLFIIAQKRK